MKEIVKWLLRVIVIILAAIAVLLPWEIRIKYSALLRWMRDQLMQNSRFIRRWALKKRWGWDLNELTIKTI